MSRGPFDSGELAPAEPTPDYLLDVRAWCAELASVGPAAFEQALVTCYPVGATIGWHRDAPALGRSSWVSRSARTA